MSAGKGSSEQEGPQGSSGASPWSSHPPAPPPPQPEPPQPQPPQSDSPQPPPYQGAYGSGREQPPGAPPATPPAQEPQQPYGQQAPYGQPSGQQPYGQPAGQQPYGQPYGSPYGQYGYPGAQPGGSGKRPGTVTAAAVLSVLGALLGLLAGVILMAGLAIDPDSLSEELRSDPSFDQLGMGLDQVLAVLWVSAAILVGWSLSAIVLAIFTLRRQQWARWLLVGSATASALLSLVAIVSIVSILPLILSVATVILLFTGGANAWFARRDTQSPPSGPQPPQWSSTPGPW